jgi:hypothetical protein
MQVSGRIKTLLHNYRKVKDHNSNTGNNRKTCKFFNEIEDLLGDRPNVTSIAPCSNRNPNRVIVKLGCIYGFTSGYIQFHKRVHPQKTLQKTVQLER